MSRRPVRDDWLLPTLVELMGPESVEELRAQAPESYWEAAVRTGEVDDDRLLQALAKRFRMRIADVALVSPQARELVPEALARKYRILPLGATDQSIEVATANPNDLDAERTLGFATGRTVRLALASPTRIQERIEELYRPENAVEKILEGVTSKYDVESISEIQDDVEMDIAGDGASKRPVIRLVDHIIAEAITSRASDIHIESEEGGIRLLYRIDGVLRETMQLPRAAGLPLVSRIKIMAQMDIADRLRPQDGRARVSVNGSRVDLRVSTLPAAHGEKVVIRILDSRSTVLSLDKLGMSDDESGRISQLVGLREGIILVTGPTGSGKTTTLYSALRTIQGRGVNIVTVEDPIEYKLGGIVQVQVNEKAGLTFASALRSILRQDPDVILVGEIRDRETATIAVQASLTGHLVLSTLHTIDAVSSVARLLDIGIESYKIAAALKGVVAQRLVRRLCQHCREVSTAPVPQRYRKWIPRDAAVYRAVGCPECTQTGYHGRLAVMEILTVTPEVERRIAAGESGERVVAAARESGMRTLWDSAMGHVASGDTTLDEVLRVVEPPMEQVAPSRNGASATTNGSAPGGPAAASVRPAAPTAREQSEAPHRTTPTSLPPPDGAFDLVDEEPDSEVAPMRGTVLLVEDEGPLRQVLTDLLSRDGWEVVEAGDGVQALDEVDRSAPDVVVLDLNLPLLDGFGVLAHLRARPATAGIPVIVLTANSDEDSEVRVFESGANDFLAKPFRPRALAARLRSLVRTGG